eukprot:TRINITY_DN7165_c0_g1_i1.p1 TRINITY_DN7165_c0_g1~~TRINITY_DN7165_c0_g1_i1.p1  ORF type:complete len:1388 (+),score=568.33 TRINITY_DN7165_c0_g1_i1:37-4200(+)
MNSEVEFSPMEPYRAGGLFGMGSSREGIFLQMDSLFAFEKGNWDVLFKSNMDWIRKLDEDVSRMPFQREISELLKPQVPNTRILLKTSPPSTSPLDPLPPIDLNLLRSIRRDLQLARRAPPRTPLDEPSLHKQDTLKRHNQDLQRTTIELRNQLLKTEMELENNKLCLEKALSREKELLEGEGMKRRAMEGERGRVEKEICELRAAEEAQREKLEGEINELQVKLKEKSDSLDSHLFDCKKNFEKMRTDLEIQFNEKCVQLEERIRNEEQMKALEKIQEESIRMEIKTKSSLQKAFEVAETKRIEEKLRVEYDRKAQEKFIEDCKKTEQRLRAEFEKRTQETLTEEINKANKVLKLEYDQKYQKTLNEESQKIHLKLKEEFEKKSHEMLLENTKSVQSQLRAQLEKQAFENLMEECRKTEERVRNEEQDLAKLNLDMEIARMEELFENEVNNGELLQEHINKLEESLKTEKEKLNQLIVEQNNKTEILKSEHKETINKLQLQFKNEKEVLLREFEKKGEEKMALEAKKFEERVAELEKSYQEKLMKECLLLEEKVRSEMNLTFKEELSLCQQQVHIELDKNIQQLLLAEEKRVEVLNKDWEAKTKELLLNTEAKVRNEEKQILNVEVSKKEVEVTKALEAKFQKSLYEESTKLEKRVREEEKRKAQERIKKECSLTEERIRKEEKLIAEKQMSQLSEQSSALLQEKLMQSKEEVEVEVKKVLELRELLEKEKREREEILEETKLKEQRIRIDLEKKAKGELVEAIKQTEQRMTKEHQKESSKLEERIRKEEQSKSEIVLKEQLKKTVEELQEDKKIGIEKARNEESTKYSQKMLEECEKLRDTLSQEHQRHLQSALTEERQKAETKLKEELQQLERQQQLESEKQLFELRLFWETEAALINQKYKQENDKLKALLEDNEAQRRQELKEKKIKKEKKQLEKLNQERENQRKFLLLFKMDKLLKSANPREAYQVRESYTPVVRSLYNKSKVKSDSPSILPVAFPVTLPPRTRSNEVIPSPDTLQNNPKPAIFQKPTSLPRASKGQEKKARRVVPVEVTVLTEKPAIELPKGQETIAKSVTVLTEKPANNPMELPKGQEKIAKSVSTVLAEKPANPIELPKPDPPKKPSAGKENNVNINPPKTSMAGNKRKRDESDLDTKPNKISSKETYTKTTDLNINTLNFDFSTSDFLDLSFDTPSTMLPPYPFFSNLLKQSPADTKETVLKFTLPNIESPVPQQPKVAPPAVPPSLPTPINNPSAPPPIRPQPEPQPNLSIPEPQQVTQMTQELPQEEEELEEEEVVAIPNMNVFPINGIPSWCSKKNLLSALQQQQSVDPDTIFGPMLNSFCNLDEVFSKKNLDQTTRKHSNLWTSKDSVSAQEELLYKKKMGWR